MALPYTVSVLLVEAREIASRYVAERWQYARSH